MKQRLLNKAEIRSTEYPPTARSIIFEMTRIAQSPLDGVLIVDKPAGHTSHDIVNAARHILGFRQIGHLGTLDPLGTGVLVLLLGRATRLAQFYSDRRKRYTCAVRFGFATDSYDADGEAQGPDSCPLLDSEILREFAASLTGRVLQTPPAFSAKKIHGRPAYELARKKKPVDLKAVEVDVFDFRLTEIEGSVAHFAIECGPGTYVRSLAHEVGQKLGTGAHLVKIVRTAVGEFTLDQALGLDEIAEAARNGELASRIVTLENMLSDLPRATVLPIVERRLGHGMRFNVAPDQIQPGKFATAQGAPDPLDAGEWKPARLRVFGQQNQLIAIAQAIVPRVYQPIVVFQPTP